MKIFSKLQDDSELASPDERNLYLQFDLVLSDVSAFLVDGDYHWSEPSFSGSAGSSVSFLPVIDKCGVILNLQQVLSGTISLSILIYLCLCPCDVWVFYPCLKMLKLFKCYILLDPSREPVLPFNKTFCTASIPRISFFSSPLSSANASCEDLSRGG